MPADAEFKGWPVCDVCAEPVEESGKAQLFMGEAKNGWLWVHDECAPDGERYRIDGDRFDTLGKVMDWTLHLASKRWFNEVEWERTVRKFWDLPDA